MTLIYFTLSLVTTKSSLNIVLFGLSDAIMKYINHLFIFILSNFISLLPLSGMSLCAFYFTLYLSFLKVILSHHISLVPRHLSTAFPFSFSSSLPPSQAPSFQAAYLLSLTPCPGCLGIDWLSPCHWSSLSILTRFGHPLSCGQRVGERGRYTRCSTALGDKIKMNERESKTKRDGEENDRGRQCVKQLVGKLYKVVTL